MQQQYHETWFLIFFRSPHSVQQAGTWEIWIYKLTLKKSKSNSIFTPLSSDYPLSAFYIQTCQNTMEIFSFEQSKKLDEQPRSGRCSFALTKHEEGSNKDSGSHHSGSKGSHKRHLVIKDCERTSNILSPFSANHHRSVRVLCWYRPTNTDINFHK